MVLFFGLVFFVAPPGNFSADALGCMYSILYLFHRYFQFLIDLVLCKQLNMFV